MKIRLNQFILALLGLFSFNRTNSQNLAYRNFNSKPSRHQPFHENIQSVAAKNRLPNNEQMQMIDADKNLLRAHHWDAWNPKVQTIEHQLEKELGSDFLETRAKKSKNYEPPTEPLPSHRRKGSEDFLNANTGGGAQGSDKATCGARFDTQKNMMIDTKESTKNGASLITVEKIPFKTDTKNMLTSLVNGCMNMCCETDQCDSSLLSLKIGDVSVT